MAKCGLMGATAAAALACAAAGPQGAAAQDVKPPESYQPVDANGVNLATGSFSVSTTEISVGPAGAGGLAYSASYDSTAKAWRHSTWGGIERQPDDFNAPLPAYTVTIMGQSVVFERLGSTGAFQAVDGYGSLTMSGGVYTFTASDGTTATFYGPSHYGYEANEGVIRQIIRPNGERIEFTYLTSGSGAAIRAYPLSITTTYGYQLHFAYPSGLGNDDAFTVTALNNAVDACAPTATTCSFSRTWPSLTLAEPSSTQRTATDSLGRVMTLTTNYGRVTGVTRPAGSSLGIGWSGGAVPRVASVSNGHGFWSYDIPERQPSQYNTTTTITAPGNFSIQYNFAWEVQDAGVIRPELRWIKNGLNHTTLINQDGGGLHSATYPEGDGVQISRNTQGNVETILRTPKPGSGLGSTTVTAVYGNCSTAVLCGRATAVTDARGNTTDYTYDSAGNLLTETGPAPTPGATRPQTRYVWEQRYAWYKQNGSSAITQAPAPIWVQVEQSQCMTGATC